MWDNNEYKIFFKDDSILDFEQIMLSSGKCPNLLPMHFIGEYSGRTAYYDCGGFVPLSHYQVCSTDDALFVLEKVLIIVSSIVDYLLSPAKATLTTDTVFYHPETGEIKIAYVPSSESPHSLRMNLLILISQLKKDVNDSYVHYLDDFARIIHANNYQLRELISMLGSIRRELYSGISS